MRPAIILLTLPAVILSLGLALLAINALMLWLTSRIVDGFTVGGFWSTLGGALIVWIVNAALRRAQRSTLSRSDAWSAADAPARRRRPPRRRRAGGCEDESVSLLLVKLALAPTLVVGSSLAGRRWGHEVSGLLVAMPLVAGPILLITELEHGAHFAARAAAASLLGLVALACFVVVFARVARHARMAARGARRLARVPRRRAGVRADRDSRPASASCSPPAHSRSRRGCYPPIRPEQDLPIAGLPAWDLPARAIATALLVLGLTGAAAGLGPTLTGALTPFPVSNTVLAAFVLVLEGPAQGRRLLARLLARRVRLRRVLLPRLRARLPLGVAAAFAIALCGALAAQLLARLIAGARGATPMEAPPPARARPDAGGWVRALARRLQRRSPSARYGFSATASMIEPHVSTAFASKSSRSPSSWRCAEAAAVGGWKRRGEPALGQHADGLHRVVGVDERQRVPGQLGVAARLPRAQVGAQVGRRRGGLGVQARAYSWTLRVSRRRSSAAFAPRARTRRSAR